MISVFGLGECPISIAATPLSRSLQLCIRRAGKVTNGIMDCLVGDVLGIRGPYGKGFPLERMMRDVVIALGGSGFATFRSLINYISDRRGSFGKVAIAYGARTGQNLYFMQECKSWEGMGMEVAMTIDICDDSWKENVVLVTSLIDRFNLDPGSAAICGQPVMINAVARKLMDRGFHLVDIYASLERHMKCRVGKCEHCSIGPYHTCQGGPVFSYDRMRDLL